MLEFLKRLFALRPAPPAPATVLQFEQRVIPRPLTLRSLLPLPGANAVELICRVCEMLPNTREPLAGLTAEDVRFTPRGGVMVAGGPRFARRSGLRGSIGHLSPEQLMGLPLDERADVFNLAVLLHECLAGRQVFVADTELGVLELVRYARLPRRPEVIPVSLYEVLQRALAVEPDARFQTVQDFCRALKPFREGERLDALLQSVLAPAVVEPPPTTPLKPGDEGARLVYADWLEEHGKPDEASWLRLESRLRSLSGGELNAALLELSALSDKVGIKFMASVARPAVEGCPIRFGFKCPLTWDSMQRTDRDEVRHCAGCRQEVHFVRTLDEARDVSMRGGCVALDPSLVRSDDDLEVGSYLGRML